MDARGSGGRSAASPRPGPQASRVWMRGELDDLGGAGASRAGSARTSTSAVPRPCFGSGERELSAVGTRRGGAVAFAHNSAAVLVEGDYSGNRADALRCRARALSGLLGALQPSHRPGVGQQAMRSSSSRTEQLLLRLWRSSIRASRRRRRRRPSGQALPVALPRAQRTPLVPLSRSPHRWEDVLIRISSTSPVGYWATQKRSAHLEGLARTRMSAAVLRKLGDVVDPLCTRPMGALVVAQDDAERLPSGEVPTTSACSDPSKMCSGTCSRERNQRQLEIRLRPPSRPILDPARAGIDSREG